MRVFVFVAAALAATTSAFGQDATPAQPPQNTATSAVQDDPDRDVNLAQPDFNLAALPTTLRLPKYGSAFRITHRFGRPLGAGDFGDLVEDLFGFDNGAIIGLAAYGTVEGTNNFKDSYSPGLGALLSREIGQYAAVYVEPLWVNNSNPEPKELVDDNDTVIIGLGTRVRIRPTVYLVLEGAPRVTGYDPGVTHVSFGIEKRAGGHNFQLNFSNGFGTTLADVARGGQNNDDWYIGFNISRKFYR